MEALTTESSGMKTSKMKTPRMEARMMVSVTMEALKTYSASSPTARLE